MCALACRNFVLNIIKLLTLTAVVYILTPCVVSSSKEVLPYADAVNEILTPLQYSGLSRFLDKNSRVTVDFKKRIWTLHNVVHFDDKGVDILDEGNSGLCGQLSRYVYHKIKNIFPLDRYKILFEKVREINYFFTPQASHFVVTITDLVAQRKYVIDPSFKRYGTVEDFEGYYYYIEEQNPATYIQVSKSPDKFFFINSASPMMIRDDLLLIFSVESVDGKVDKDHFILSISAVKPQATQGEYVLGLKFTDGYLQTYSNDDLVHRLFTEDEITHLQQRMFQWSLAISRN